MLDRRISGVGAGSYASTNVHSDASHVLAFDYALAGLPAARPATLCGNSMTSSMAPAKVGIANR